MNDQDFAQAVHFCQEQIGSGENCPACGASWQPDHGDRSQRLMYHHPQCAYIQALPLIEGEG